MVRRTFSINAFRINAKILFKMKNNHHYTTAGPSTRDCLVDRITYSIAYTV